MANVKEFLNNNLVDSAERARKDKEVLERLNSDLPFYIASATKDLLESIPDTILYDITTTRNEPFTTIFNIQASMHDKVLVIYRDYFLIWRDLIHNVIKEHYELLTFNKSKNNLQYLIKSLDDSLGSRTGDRLANLLELDINKFEITMTSLYFDNNDADKLEITFKVYHKV